MEEIFIKYSEYAQNNNFQLNSDKKTVERILHGLLQNEKMKGRKYCPCRVLSGDQEEDLKKICPCFFHKEEIEQDGRCYCGLFTK